MPWPANAASPWSSTGRARFQASGPWPAMRSCLARTTPSTTGSTASRCDGLDSTWIATSRPDSERRVVRAPWWYFTSPSSAGKSGCTTPSKPLKMRSAELPTTLARMFSRPRCDMPMTTSSTPRAAAPSTSRSSSGMAVSQPSTE